MTYCVGMRLNAGLVFLSDSRTNAGVDQVGTFRKMNVFEIPGDRMMVMMTAGNLSISQSVRQLIADHASVDGRSIWNAPNMYEAARLVGEAVRQVHERDAKSLGEFGIQYNVSIIFGIRFFVVPAAGAIVGRTNPRPGQCRWRRHQCHQGCQRIWHHQENEAGRAADFH